MSEQPTPEGGTKSRAERLREANLALLSTAKRVREAEEELNSAEYAHSQAVRLLEQLEQAE